MDFVSPVLNLIGSEILAEYARINGISDKLKTWGRNLRMIQAVMDSAEERQMKGDPAVDQWLLDLREVAYDMEDLLDEFSVEAKRRESKVQDASRSSKFPRRLIACCTRIDRRNLISKHYMAKEIEEVDLRLEEVIRNIEILKLVQNHTIASPPPARYGQVRSFTTSLPEPKFFGREKQMEELLARLTGSESTDDSIRPFSVVSIVGMGGVGKTTMAQQLYNHQSLDVAAFAVKAWACVSDVFDRIAITKTIRDQIVQTSSNKEKEDLNQLQNSLKENISGKKFLIVLDDVWNTDYAELESLLKPLHFGSKGSRILLTTRILDVTKLVGDSRPLRLDTLDSEDCECLLAYHSIGEENFVRHLHLQDVAAQLSAKCKGLPLSIKAIGGLLRCLEMDEEKWKKVLADNIWNREDGKIPPALKLSYARLPLDLKRCFAACAIFPKDYMFDQDEAIRLWIIHGLLKKGSARTYQEVGMETLCRLEEVSLLQKARDKNSCYLMHDLINDLAKSISAGAYFSSDEHKEGSSGVESLGLVRHVSIVAQDQERYVSRRFDVYRSMTKLRTFIPFQMSAIPVPNVYVSQRVIQDLIMDMKKLRMLSLRSFRVREVSHQIGSLKLLRSVDFSFTKIQVLPESICDLVELQSLLLRMCGELTELPRNIHKLTNLLHLDISGPNRLKEMPPRIGELTNLEILSNFIVGKEDGQELRQLGPLKCLEGDLDIENLVDVDDVEDTRIANLCEKETVRGLRFDFCPISNTSRSSDEHQFQLLDRLKPPGKIQSLDIYGYGGNQFPRWFDNACLNNVVDITLMHCGSVDTLPPFGRLPWLESLQIYDLKAVTSIGDEFFGTKTPFRSLKSLLFSNLSSWEKWSSHGDHVNDQPFPLLRQLWMTSCPKLNLGFTLSLPSLVEIAIFDCGGKLLKCLANLTSLTKMDIIDIPQLVHFDKTFSASWVALEEMRIRNCPQFKSFMDEDGWKHMPPKLKYLEISHCRDLEKLPDDLSGFTSLNEMNIHNCEKLSSFPNAGLPPALRKVRLSSCPSLPTSQVISSRFTESLEELILEELGGLESIPEFALGTRLSRSLRVLVIQGCGSIITLSDSLQHLSTLSELTIKNWEALDVDCLPSLPHCLSNLTLEKCPTVKSLPQDMSSLTSLKRLVIRDCDNIKSLPRGGLPPSLIRLEIMRSGGLEVDCFPSLPCNLSSLELRGCPRVTSLPQDMHNLTSLKILRIVSCGITSLPGKGLPWSLEMLCISDCGELNQPLEEWGLNRLPALRNLLIGDGTGCLDEIECFPPPNGGRDAWCGILPPSLVILCIRKMKKLERVGRGLSTHLTSLQTLKIHGCEKMSWLPDDGLPDSLEELRIEGCPLLERRLERNGDYWPFIECIPLVSIGLV